MTQQQIRQELIWAGLGDYNKDGDSLMVLEAYGDGVLNVVHVYGDGLTKFIDGNGYTLWEGYFDTEEEYPQEAIHQLLTKFGHYAPS